MLSPRNLLSAAVLLLSPSLLVSVCSAQATAPTPAPAPAPRLNPAQVSAPQQATPQAAPQQAAPPDEGGFVIKVPVNEVNLVFTVTDKNGHFVKDLHQQDFQLLDAHMPPARVLHFTQQTDLPLRVGLLIDTSSSVHSRFDFEQRSAIDFLQQVLRPREDLAFVMSFDSQPDLTQGYTSNVDLLSQGIESMKSNGGTAMYDALYKACRDEMLGIKSNQSLRKTIVLLTDGHDNQSHVEQDEAIKMCQRAETSVYTISTNLSPTHDNQGEKVLSEIAEATGGNFFLPRREEDVAHAFFQISEELRSQYALDYRPADFKSNGEFRQIWLVANNPKYHVRALQGYFAPKE
jgi:VWFA-related protein